MCEGGREGGREDPCGLDGLLSVALTLPFLSQIWVSGCFDLRGSLGPEGECRGSQGVAVHVVVGGPFFLLGWGEGSGGKEGAVNGGHQHS